MVALFIWLSVSFFQLLLSTPLATHGFGAISTSPKELATLVGGTGRSTIIWDCYKCGIDPAIYFDPSLSSVEYDVYNARKLLDVIHEDTNNLESSIKDQIQKQLPTSRYGQTLGSNALSLLASTYATSLSKSDPTARIEDGLASLSHISVASDGTTKLLIKLRDGLEVETVIIPWFDNQYSPLCISSQVGCRMACQFCATGKMNLLRNLTSDEILAQYFYAVKICRLSQSISSSSSSKAKSLPKISNLVFMGMGEPTDVANDVNVALRILTDETLYHLSPSKVTVSTVGPTPESFALFAQSPCVLAWSVHAANDELRKKLVPTTKYSMEQLRNGLVKALLQKPEKLRNTMMLEVVLIDEVNDGIKEAHELADLALKIAEDVPGIKVMVNLIPFNDIGSPFFKKPREKRVRQFQECLWDRGVFVHIRTTRGDEENSACGQLATINRKRKN